MEEQVVLAPPRPDLEAYERVTKIADVSEVVSELARHLGLALVAEIAGVSETRAVREWQSGERAPRSAELDTKLRLALRIVYMLEAYDSDAVIRSWFTGLNPRLEDNAPADVLREGTLPESGRDVLNAARAFIVTG